MATKPGPGCPSCGGQTGHQHVMTESHLMIGSWGESAVSVDCGEQVKKVVRSLVECLDCGAKFKHEALVRKELA